MRMAGKFRIERVIGELIGWRARIFYFVWKRSFYV